MPHSYEHIDSQHSSVGDELYNLTQLAEVSIVYFKHHTTNIIEDTKPFDKVSVPNPIPDSGYRNQAQQVFCDVVFDKGELQFWNGVRGVPYAGIWYSSQLATLATVSSVDQCSSSGGSRSSFWSRKL